MKKLYLFLVPVVLFATSCSKEDVTPVSSSTGEVKATWSSSDKWATWANGGYTIENNVWGSNPGPQSIWANSYSNWGVWANHSGSGIKSYPNVDKSIGKAVNSLGTLKSSFNATNPSGTSYDLAYDIWCNGSTYETMIWYSWSGTQPIAASYNASGQAVATYTNQSIGGSTWNVYKGSNGSNAVFSFLRTSQASSGTVDIKAILQWINGKGWFSNPTVSKVQFGWEIINTGGSGKNFQINSYSVTSN